MAVDASKVRVGTPDQLTTGAIMCAPLGTALPELSDITAAGVTIDPAFMDAGYANEDGITLTPDMSTSTIKEWGGSIVRNVLEEFNGTISFTLIQTDETAFKMAFGDDYVVAQAATAEHGGQLKASLGAHLPEAKSWVFKMKDGAARMLIVVPNGQVSAVDEITLNATDPIGWAITVSCYPDESGNSIYIMTDDGQVSSSTQPDTPGEGDEYVAMTDEEINEMFDGDEQAQA